MNQELQSRFFEDRDDTGRYVIVSFKTGIRYFIEPIGDGRMADWGSYNPSTGNVENKKGAGKYKGSIKLEESLISEKNGFKNISIIKGSPEGEISDRDDEHYKNGIRPKNYDENGIFGKAYEKAINKQK